MAEEITVGVFKGFLKGIPITIAIASVVFALGDYRATDKSTAESLERHMSLLQVGLDKQTEATNKQRDTTDELSRRIERLTQAMEDQKETFRTRIR